jgi:SCY1-like protein 1
MCADPALSQKGPYSCYACRHHPAVADAYALGLLLHAVFNPSAGPPPTFTPPHSPPSAASRGAIPTVIFSSFKKLLNPSPRARMSTQVFLDLGVSTTGGAEAGFFANNPLVKVCQGLDNFGLASENERAGFLRYHLVPFFHATMS